MVDYDKDVDKITEYGPQFQSKVLASLMKDGQFLGQTFDVLNPNFFESESSKWICNKIIEYYVDYKDTPTLPYFRAEIDELDKNKSLRAEVLAQLKDSYDHITDKDLNYVQDKFLDFAKNQALKNAILRSAEMLERGRMGEIKQLIDEAMKAGTQKDVGLIWEEDFIARHHEDPRNTVTTGWDAVDRYMDGGLAAGELGVIMAPSGAGKSWVLTHLGKVAMQSGLNVLHYSFELNQNYQGIRYDASFSGITPSRIKDNLDHVKSFVDDVDGRLIIKYFPSRSVNVHSLRAHIDYLHIQRGFTPDIILIDYADIMLAATKSQARYEELGYIYEELRSLAGELQIPIWTASQTQRSSIGDDIIEADKVGESYNKIKTSDVILSLSRKTEDKINDTARFHMVKNRFGSDGVTFPAKFDAATGFIDIADPHSDLGMSLSSQMQNGKDEHNKQLLEKLKKLKNRQ